MRDARNAALEAREAALDAKELQMDAIKAKLDAETSYKSPKNQPDLKDFLIEKDKKASNDRTAAFPKSQITGSHTPGPLVTPPGNEKVKLHTVYHLFKWTHESVRKFGHDRLEIMLESYQIMGYISKASTDDIRRYPV